MTDVFCHGCLNRYRGLPFIHLNFQGRGSAAGWRASAIWLAWAWICRNFPSQVTSSCKLAVETFHILVLLSGVTSFYLELGIPGWTRTSDSPQGNKYLYPCVKITKVLLTEEVANAVSY